MCSLKCAIHYDDAQSAYNQTLNNRANYIHLFYICHNVVFLH
jgi:hypothetical protein